MTTAVHRAHLLMQSPMLFAREFLKIKNKKGQIVPFDYNSLQRRRYLEIMRRYWKPVETDSGDLWYRIQGVRYVDLKFRQWGESTLWCSLFNHDTWCNPGTSTYIYCQDASFSAKMIKKYKLFWRHMPEDLRPSIRNPHTVGSSNKLDFMDIDSMVVAGTPGASESVADKQGRSETINNCHLSEFSKWAAPRVMLNALEEAVPAEGNIFIEASPDKMGDYFHIMYTNGKEEESPWESHFTPWFAFPAYAHQLTPEEEAKIISSLSKEEIDLIGEYNLTPGQISWRRMKIRSKQGDVNAFLKEYPEDDATCFELNASLVFDNPELRQPRCEQRTVGIPGHIHAIGVDVGSGGDDSDFSAIEVIDVNNMENCYSWRGRVSPDDLAYRVYEVWKAFPGLVGIEVNGLGAATVSTAFKIEDWLLPSPGFLFSNNRTLGGWMTSGANKSKSIYLLRFNLLEEVNGNPGLKLGSPYVQKEMMWFQHLGGNKMGSPGTITGDGGKLTDDNIMALMIANGMIEWMPGIQDIFYQRFGMAGKAA